MKVPFSYIFVPWMALALVLGGGVNARARENPYNVLVLHSYHPGYPWTDRVMAGIQDVFTENGSHIRLNPEYLDTHRNSDTEYFTGILDAILHHKLEGRSFDLVVTTGREALDFVLTHRDDLFLGTPLVFCGLSDFDPNALTAPHLLTGVFERPDYSGTVRLALRLHDGLKKMVVIGTLRNATGRLEHRRMQETAAAFSGYLTFVFWNDIPAEELQKRLNSLGKGTVILLNSPLQDREGHLLSPSEEERLFEARPEIPLYSPWKHRLGFGVVGGPLVDLERQGKLAAMMALHVLEGEKPAQLPVKEVPPAPALFDDRKIRSLGIHRERIPAGSQLLYQPPSYRLTRQQGIALAVTLAASISLTAFLSHTILRRRKAEASLRESEGRYRQLSEQFRIILDGIPDGVTLISPDMRVVWSNKGAGNRIGGVLGETPGEYCCKLLYNRPAVCENCPAIETFRTGRSSEALIRTPDDRELEVKAFPMLGRESGVVTHVILLASDVTEKKKLQEEAIRSSRLVSLGELAAGIAHEINNPNALILLNASLVRRACHDAAPILMEHYREKGDFTLGGLMYSEMCQELPHLFAEMQEAAERIRRIVADLKDFARPETSDLRAEVDLNVVTQAAVRLLGNTLKQATGFFSAEYAETLPKFRGNFQKIEQVAVNLLVNACQALPDRERAIAVATGYDPARKVVWLQVRDEGTGIPPEVLPFITDPFFTTKRENGGTGLGLSVSSRIVSDHGGNLDFVSNPGQGTTITVKLPVL